MTNNTNNEKTLLTVTETAKILGMSRGHIFNLVNRGFFPTVRMGRTLRIPRAWLDQHIADAVRDWERAHRF